MCTQQFKGRKLVIATKHEKEKVIAPLFKKHLGVEIVVPKDFNSDKFGTFTREIKRTGNQLEAARKKALHAMSLAKVDLAVASEGSFGPSQSAPHLQSNLELVLFIDKKNNYEIRGHYESFKTNIDGRYVKSIDEALEFAEKIGFPEHGIILRKSKSNKFGIEKSIHSKEMLIERLNNAFAKPFFKKVFLEADMRAHRNPTRMQVIKRATEDLIKNIKSECPKCNTPGFTPKDFERGLPCSYCGTPTELTLYEVFSCSNCGYKEKKHTKKFGKFAGPEYCENCNP